VEVLGAVGWVAMLDGPREHPDFFDGSVLRWARVAGLALGEIVYPPAQERPVHAHDRACFHYLLEGGYVEQHGRDTNECTTHTLAFQPVGHEHSYRGVTVRSRSFTIELDEAWTTRLREHGVALESPGHVRGGLASWLQARLYREFCSMDAASPLAIEALALELAVETARHGERLGDPAAGTGKKPPPWLLQATDLLHDRLAEPLTLADIARAVGVHPVHVARVFRRHHRCTVGEYVRGLRVDLACRELAHSNASLSEIALAAGFPDQSHFSRVFKRVTGLTPGTFRAETQSRRGQRAR
jgi:AraC family transcriptional regulator